MGKSTISMAMFNSFLYVYQAGYVPFDAQKYHQAVLIFWDPWGPIWIRASHGITMKLS